MSVTLHVFAGAHVCGGVKVEARGLRHCPPWFWDGLSSLHVWLTKEPMAWPGFCQSLPGRARISSMHHHVYLVTLKLKTEFRAPCLYGKYFTPKLDPQSKSWVLKVEFGSLASTGAKGQSFVPQLRRFSESSVGGKVNKDFARGWEHPQMRDNEARYKDFARG